MLTIVFGDTVLVVVLEERVQACSVDQHVVAGYNAQTPTLVTRCGETLRGADREVRVGKSGLLNVVWHKSTWVGLPVWGLGLNVAHENVLGVQELVVVQNRVLGGGTPEPGSIGLDEHTTAVVNVDLIVVWEIKLVVSDPKPSVLKIDVGRGRGGVEQQEGSIAVWVGSRMGD